jgi:glyoxylase-like metal-dependent hydrolase (beta-lactamase superfamily II)
MTSFVAGDDSGSAPRPPGGEGHRLKWRAFPAGEGGFFRAPVLLTGPCEALLIDGGFTYEDAREVIEEIRACGKKLTMIYVSQSDPDYYFNLKPIVTAFPDAKVLAAGDTVRAIMGNVAKKLAFWGPQLKDNGPRTAADIVMPEVFDGSWLAVDGRQRGWPAAATACCPWGGP